MLYRLSAGIATTLKARRLWSAYFTGTSFSMDRVISEAHLASHLRKGLRKVTPSFFFKLADMVGLLTHYWNFPESTLRDECVQAALSMFAGRPLVFVNGVFEPLFRAVFVEKSLSTLSVDEFLPLLLKQRREIVQTFQTKLAIKLANDSVVANPAIGHFSFLLPRILEAVFFEDGKLSADDVVGEIIASGLVASAAPVEPGAVIDMKEEPLVHEAYRLAILQNFQAMWLNILVRRAGGGDPTSNGFLLEKVVAHVLSFRHIEAHQRKQLASLDNYRPLSEILGQLGVAPDVWSVLAGWEGRPYRAVDASTFTVPFERFLAGGAHGVYDDTLVLYKLQPGFGVDLAFLTSRVLESEERVHRAMVFQVKNSSATFKDMLRTLSPGCQRIEDAARDLLLQNEPVCVKPHTFRKEWLGFAEAHPCLAREWVRVCVAARSPTLGLVTKISEFNAEEGKVCPIFILPCSSSWLGETVHGLLVNKVQPQIGVPQDVLRLAEVPVEAIRAAMERWDQEASAQMVPAAKGASGKRRGGRGGRK